MAGERGRIRKPAETRSVCCVTKVGQPYASTCVDTDETVSDQPICKVRNRRVTFFESERHGTSAGEPGEDESPGQRLTGAGFDSR